MEKKKYWFFGSKLNSVLLLVLIILMVFAIRIMLQNKGLYFGAFYQDNEKYAHTTALDVGKGNQLNKNDSKVDLSGWKLIPEQNDNVFYNEKWKYEKNIDNQYSFTLSSGNYLNWAYTGSGCTDNLKDRENTNFKYGVSESGCIKGWTVWLGVQDVHDKNTQEDLNSLGDFILKNK